MMVVKIKKERTLEFENYKNYLERAQVDNKINYLEKKEISMDSFFVTKEK